MPPFLCFAACGYVTVLHLFSVAFDDGPEGGVQVGPVAVHVYGIVFQDQAVAGAADEFDDGEEQEPGLPVADGSLGSQGTEVGQVVGLGQMDRPAEDPPAEVFVDEAQETGIFFKLVDDVVDQQDHEFRKVGDIFPVDAFHGPGEDFLPLVDDQLFLQVVFVPEIEIKGALGHTGPVRDIGDGGPFDAQGGIELEGRIQQALLFQ